MRDCSGEEEVLFIGLCEGFGSRMGTAAGGIGCSSSFTLGFCLAAALKQFSGQSGLQARGSTSVLISGWHLLPLACQGTFFPRAPAALPTALKSVLDLKSLSEIPRKVAAFLIEP